MFLASPPFALGALALVLAAAIAAAAGAWIVAAVFAGGLVALALTLVTGLLQARAGLRTWLALLPRPGTWASRRSCSCARSSACCAAIASTGRPPAPDGTPMLVAPR